MVLANKIVLVEGPSDEIIFQRIFKDIYNKNPMECGIDVLSMRGLSLRRFLDSKGAAYACELGRLAHELVEASNGCSDGPFCLLPTGLGNTEEPLIEELKEQHYTIHYGATGYSYESIIGPYLDGAKSIEIEDPYIRVTHQIQNFVRFCEAVIKTPTVRKTRLVTSCDDDTDVKEMSERLSELKQSLLELDIELEIKVNEHMHDREIRIDNGWTVKIGRGLDFFQRPDSWFGVGSNDLNLRKCLETKVDIFKR